MGMEGNFIMRFMTNVMFFHGKLSFMTNQSVLTLCSIQLVNCLV